VDPIQLQQIMQMMRQRQMMQGGGMSPLNGQQQPMGGQLPSYSQPQPSGQLPPIGGQMSPGGGMTGAPLQGDPSQQPQHHHNPLGPFAPLFGLSGMLMGGKMGLSPMFGLAGILGHKAKLF
jgi:hypothetical protein